MLVILSELSESNLFILKSFLQKNETYKYRIDVYK